MSGTNVAEPIGVAFLSGVRHAASYLPMVMAQPDLRVRAIGEERDAPDWAQDDARALAARHEVPVAIGLDDLLANPEIALAIVCSEPTRHARLAAMALAAGKHVLVDKPMGTTVADCQKLAAAVAAASGRLTVMHRLFSPAIQRARAAIVAGHLGLIRAIDVEWLASDGLSGRAVERPELVADPALSGGGELMNFLVYPVSYLRYLTGLEIVEVYTESATLFFAPHRQYGVEDIGILSVRMEHDVVATVTVGRVPRAPSAAPVASSLRLIGSHGHLTVDEGKPELDLWGSQGWSGRRIGGEAATIAVTTLFAEFASDIRLGREPLFGVNDGIAVAAAVEAAYQSVATGQPVAVEPVVAIEQSRV